MKNNLDSSQKKNFIYENMRGKLIKTNKNEIKLAISKTKSMAEASKLINIPYGIFIRQAKKYNLYMPNQAGKKISKKKRDGHGKIPLIEILNGEHPKYQTRKLKLRLIEEDIFQNKCSICGISEWCGKELVCVLDHIDGNSINHRKENLRILCPNCHSQTETFAGKNIGNNRQLKKEE